MCDVVEEVSVFQKKKIEQGIRCVSFCYEGMSYLHLSSLLSFFFSWGRYFIFTQNR